MDSYTRENKHPKNRQPKRQSQISHAKYRAKKRAKIILTDERHAAIIKAIQGEQVEGITVKFKESQSQSRKVYTIWFENLGKIFDLIYDAERKSLITFLPHDGSCMVYGYYDVFGNKINIKADYGFNMKFDGGVLTCAYLDIEMLDFDRWYIKDWDKVLVMKDGSLHEIMT